MMTSRSLAALALSLALAPACGASPDGIGDESAVGAAKQAVTTSSTTDVVTRIQDASRALQQARIALNDLVAGAYSAWPSKAEFQRANTIRGFANDLDALNAAARIAGAYAAGAYVAPSLDFEARNLMAGAYSNNISAAGAYAFGLGGIGAYVLPSGAIAGSYIAGSYENNILERVSRVNRE